MQASRCAVNFISGVATLQAERHSNSGASHKAVMSSRLRRDEHEQGVAAVLQIVGRIVTSLVVVDASRLGSNGPEGVRWWWRYSNDGAESARRPYLIWSM